MKNTTIFIISFLVFVWICLFASCEKKAMYSTATAKSSIDLKLYKGVVLVGKRMTIDIPWEPVGSYAYAFRKKDSI